ncbi:MAG TPA: hypothetical protein DCS42_11445, partial [Nitrospiraceae bacterium]|nr:hypothetical protein [Nitrospiraceae bacterium]
MVSQQVLALRFLALPRLQGAQLGPQILKTPVIGGYRVPKLVKAAEGVEHRKLVLQREKRLMLMLAVNVGQMG